MASISLPNIFSRAGSFHVIRFSIRFLLLTSVAMAVSADASSDASGRLKPRTVAATQVVQLGEFERVPTQLFTDSRVAPAPTPTEALSDIFELDPSSDMVSSVSIAIGSPVATATLRLTGVKTIPPDALSSEGASDMSISTFSDNSAPSPSPSAAPKKGMDPSTIAAIALAVGLFVVIAAIGSYCLWAHRRGRIHYKHRVRGNSVQWTVVRNGGSGSSSMNKRESLLPTHERNYSISRPIPESFVHNSQFNYPPPQFPGISEPKQAYAPPMAFGGHIYKPSLDTPPANLDYAVTEKFVRPERRITVDLSQPAPILRSDTKKRPTPPQLIIPDGSPKTANDAFTTTTVAGLTTNVYVPPTPSSRSFGDGPLSPRAQLAPVAQGRMVGGRLTPCDYFSPDEIKPCPSPPPKDTHRFSDPMTPTPASMRSVRSLSWNGHGLPARPGPKPKEQVVPPVDAAPATTGHPEWLYTSAAARREDAGTTPIEGDAQHRWIPVEYERDSMTTHAYSNSSGIASYSEQTYNPSKLSRSTRESDYTTTDDTGSVIESDYDSHYDEESSDEASSNNTFTPRGRSTYRRSSLATGRSYSTRFSQASVTDDDRDNYPLPNLLDSKWHTDNQANGFDGTQARQLSSPGIFIVPNLGGESPPMSPVTFKLDNVPVMTPNPLTAPPQVLPPTVQKRTDSDTDDDSYPVEWSQQLERIAAEEAKAKAAQKLHGPSPLRESVLVPPLKFGKRKSVAFATDSPVGRVETPGTGTTVRKIRPSWYVTASDGTKMGMF